MDKKEHDDLTSKNVTDWWENVVPKNSTLSMAQWQRKYLNELRPTKKLYILAHTHIQATMWAEENEVPICKGHKYGSIYVGHPDRLRGLRNIVIVLLDGWWHNSDAPRLGRIVDELSYLSRAVVVNEQNFKKELLWEDIQR
jgi:hypothetical protein